MPTALKRSGDARGRARLPVPARIPRRLPSVDPEAYRGAESVASALANRYRIALLAQLEVCGEACACELQPSVGLPQSSVTLHLQKLHRDGLIARHERGKYTYFRLRDEGRKLLSLLQRLDLAPRAGTGDGPLAHGGPGGPGRPGRGRVPIRKKVRKEGFL
jgi:ArsR family transcriptional regulator